MLPAFILLKGQSGLVDSARAAEARPLLPHLVCPFVGEIVGKPNNDSRPFDQRCQPGILQQDCSFQARMRRMEAAEFGDDDDGQGSFRALEDVI